MVERQTPNLMVGGSNPSWPARVLKNTIEYRENEAGKIFKVE